MKESIGVYKGCHHKIVNGKMYYHNGVKWALSSKCQKKVIRRINRKPDPFSYFDTSLSEHRRG